MLQYPDNPDFVPSAYGPPEPLKQGDRKFKRQSRPAVVVDDSNRSFGADCNKYKDKDCNEDKYKDCDNKDKRQSRLAVVVDDSNRPLNTDRLRLEKAKRKVKMS